MHDYISCWLASRSCQKSRLENATKGQSIPKMLSARLWISAGERKPKAREPEPLGQLKAAAVGRQRWRRVKAGVRVLFSGAGIFKQVILWKNSTAGILRPAPRLYISITQAEGRVVFWYQYSQKRWDQQCVHQARFEAAKPSLYSSWGAARTPTWTFLTYTQTGTTPWLIISLLRRDWQAADLHHGIWTHQLDWMIKWLVESSDALIQNSFPSAALAQVINEHPFFFGLRRF